jgi:hypothetical protein
MLFATPYGLLRIRIHSDTSLQKLYDSSVEYSPSQGRVNFWGGSDS